VASVCIKLRSGTQAPQIELGQRYSSAFPSREGKALGQNQNTTGDSSAVGFNSVFKDELNHLNIRREATGRPSLVPPEGTKTRPTVGHDFHCSPGEGDF